MILALYIAALILSIIALVQSKGSSLVAWATLLLSLIGCLPLFP